MFYAIDILKLNFRHKNDVVRLYFETLIPIPKKPRISCFHLRDLNKGY